MSLEAFLGSLSGEDFLANYWDKKPCVIRGGSERIELVLHSQQTTLTFCEALRRALPGNDTPGIMMLRKRDDAVERSGDVEIRREAIFDIPLAADRTAKILEEGLREGLLMVDDVHRYHPWLMEFCTSLRASIGQPGNLNTYLFIHSSARSGRGMHFDSDNTFFIQLEGQRRFRYSSEPILPTPFAAASYDGQRYIETNTKQPYRFTTPPPPLRANLIEEVVLNPGDLFFFPGGCVHETSSETDGSMGLAISISWIRMADLVDQILRGNVDRYARRWRRPIPPHGGDIATLDQAVCPLVEERASFVDLPPEERQSIIMHQVRTMLAAPTGSLMRPLLAEPLDADSILRQHPTLSFARVSPPEGEVGLDILVGEQLIEFREPRFLAFADYLVSHRRIVVSDVANCVQPAYTPDEIGPKLQELLEAGYLVFESGLD